MVRQQANVYRNRRIEIITLGHENLAGFSYRCLVGLRKELVVDGVRKPPRAVGAYILLFIDYLERFSINIFVLIILRYVWITADMIVGVV